MATSFYRPRLPDVVALMETGRWQTALAHGALLGCVAYATYDLTSQATLKQWSTAVTVVDMAWGTVYRGISALLGFFAARWVAATFG